MIAGVGAVAKHSPQAIAQAWARNGGRKAAIPTAVAIVMCESGGDDDASSFCCHGAYQLHQDHTAISCARNIDCATKRAIELSNNGRDWSAWDCHPDSRGRTGSMPTVDARFARYQRKFTNLGDTLGDIFGPSLPGGIPGAPDISSPLDDVLGLGAIKDAVEAIAKFFVGLGELLLTPDGWKRLAKIGGGAIIVLWGLNVLMKQTTGTNPGGTVRRIAAAGATRGASELA